MIPKLSALVLCILAFNQSWTTQAQEKESRELQNILSELRGKLTYLPDERAVEGRPVVDLVVPLEGDEIESKVTQLQLIAKHTVVRTLTFSYDNLEMLRRCLAVLPDLEEVTTSSSIDVEFLKQLQQHKHLRSINLVNVKYGSRDLDETTSEKVRRETLEHLGTMKQLRVRMSVQLLTDEKCRPLVSLKNLVELNVTDSLELSSKGLKILSQNTSLKRLSLQNVRIDDEGLDNLAELTKLDKLHVTDLTSSDETRLEQLKLTRPKPLTGKALRCLHNFTEMKDLALIELPLDPDEGLSFLHKMPKLESFVLSQGGFSINFVGDVAQAKKKRYHATQANSVFSDFSELKDLKELRHLELQTAFRCTCEIAALEKFPQLEKVESLTLGNPGFLTKDGLPLLAKKMPNVKSCTFFTEAITDEHLPLFCEFKHLRYLALSPYCLRGKNAQVTLDGLARLKGAKPEATIYLGLEQLGGPDVKQFNLILSLRAKELKDDK